MRIAIREIKINDRRREAIAEKVKALAQSMAEIGLLNPVTVDRAHCRTAPAGSRKAAGLDRDRVYDMQFEQFAGGTC